MIARYCRPEMTKIWSLQHKYQCWLTVEIAVCRAMNRIGLLPAEDLKNIVSKASFSEARIEEIELVTKHDFIAFLTNVTETVGTSGRWIHFGMTSSDVIDTALAMQCKQAGELIIKEINSLCQALKLRSLEFKKVLSIGRSHGIHAEPTSFGLKFALWYDEMQRNRQRITAAIESMTVGKISGAMGNYAHLDPRIEEYACADLGLKPVHIATQVIQRDLHAELISMIAIIGSTMEKIAIEIRHLQRTEVLEVEENFTSGQKGSSAMPHKKNPITCEQITGLARILRTNAQAALENNALWHERDLSHSSVERIIIPDSTILLHYMLHQMTWIIKDLVVYQDNIARNLQQTQGLIFSQILLLKLTASGLTREKAYEIVQRNALVCWEKKINFQDLIQQDQELMDNLCREEIEEIFSDHRYLKNIDYIYQKIGLNN